MEPKNENTLPFITRKQLNFEQGTTFGVKIRSSCLSSGDVTIRGFTKEGAFTFVHRNDGSGDPNTQTFNLPDIPIMISVQDVLANFVADSFFASLSLVINGDEMGELCAGMVYEERGISYPHSSQPGIGIKSARINATGVSSPSAGSEVSFTIPSGVAWKVLAVRIRLVTDATVANRRVHLVFKQNTRPICDMFSDVDQTASQTRDYSFAPFGALPDTSDDNDILVPIPQGIILKGQNTIETLTTNLQAGDDFGTCDILVEEFFF